MEKTTAIAACGGDASLLLLFPEDSLIQILMRLPIKSLLRFKSVCKSWRDLIETSFFIDLHSNFNSSSSTNFILITDDDKVIFMRSEYEGSEYGDGDGDVYVYVFKVDDGDELLLLKVDNFELRSSCYRLPYTYSKYNIAIAGSCNGLICLYDSKLWNVFLWNPDTRQCRILPKSITIEIYDDFVHYGVDFVAFGFDVKTKDYKVLLITKFSSKSGPQWPTKFSRVQVYSLSTDSWRLFEGINSPLALPSAENYGLYLSGSCFFIASVYHPESNTSSRFINSFDFTKEIFTTMQLPDHDSRRRLFLRCLGGEKMALFTTLRKRPSDEYDSDDSNDADGYEDCDIWVLNEHHGGVNKESWTKLHSFQIKNNRDCEPIGISNNGKLALLDTTGLAYDRSMRLYNLVTKEVKLDIPLGVSMSKVYVYKPSLVSISSLAIG